MEQTLQIGMKRALVIEDEPCISEICKLALGDEGLQVDTAENGSIALDIFRRDEEYE